MFSGVTDLNSYYLFELTGSREERTMTLKERVIVETYTGIVMTSPEERDEVYKYMAEKMGRPVFTHGLASKEIQEQLKEKTLDDFKTLCISDEAWKKARDNVGMLLPLYLEIGACGYFGVMHLNSLIKRYDSGERTLDLYESMKSAE